MARFTPPAADAMRATLLAAARDEFTAHGLAGARVERLAAAAGSNKAQVFHYFGGKDGLFDALLVHEVTSVLTAVPLDTADLAGWAGRLHDVTVERPWVQRLATWHRLERPEVPVETLAEQHADVVAEVERAQRADVLPRRFRPAVLFGLVVHTAVFWSALPPEAAGSVAAVTAPRRRQVVVDAVGALLGR
ncbi:TetR family transcriptional regulator [Curtobacterium caseinilyticum]|uniref:TetR family transcriptional regulator n=1 Tax=Curtobacterium caseinilyticum TaxID=3055137 RepID=A0ABT7TNZ0_9MICO|nr:TetR family transcriptional regulator [Curtobacterium caseinilyticum]MDM7891240.1 TetR family transcriptional regulator [Curtobacterium caseinilyticum]